jgi:hypothetical protein
MLVSPWATGVGLKSAWIAAYFYCAPFEVNSMQMGATGNGCYERGYGVFLEKGY